MTQLAQKPNRTNKNLEKSFSKKSKVNRLYEKIAGTTKTFKSKLSSAKLTPI